MTSTQSLTRADDRRRGTSPWMLVTAREVAVKLRDRNFLAST